jgi:hypothetical protein
MVGGRSCYGYISGMATRTTVQLEDDLSGGVAAETIRFGLDGRLYEIDLSAKNAQKLRQTLSTYVAAGRRLGRVASAAIWPGVPAQRSGSTENAAAMRKWATENGYEVHSRGRIPAYIREAYRSS